MADATNDKLSSVDQATWGQNWDWKGAYVSSLNEDGLERFSQFSGAPDSTILLAGPARFSGLAGGASSLIPIGLCDNISYQNNVQLMRLFEIGSNRSFFTRGKSAPTLSLSKVLADQANILAALSAAAYRPLVADAGQSAPGVPGSNILMNLDSEYFSNSFGLLLVMKTRGGGDSGYGKTLAAMYLEYCNFSNYSFQIASQTPVIAESIQIEFDRVVPVSLS